MATVRRIFNYTSQETADLIEEVMLERKRGYGACYNYLIERWLLMGISKEGTAEQKKRADKILKERFNYF